MKHKNLLTEMMKAILNGKYILSKSAGAIFLASMVFLFVVITNSCNKENAELAEEMAYDYSSEIDDDYDTDDEDNDKSKPKIPRPHDDKAYWAAEKGETVNSQGGIVTADGKYQGSHRKCTGTPGSQPSSPFWERVKNPKYEGNRSWKVVSQQGNGRNEQRIFRDYNPVTHGGRWFAFAVRICPSTPNPSSHFMFAQLHQAADGMNPPVFLQWTGSQWHFIIRTDNGIAGKNFRRVLASGPMHRGQWYHFRLRLRPGLNGTAITGLSLKENGSWQNKTLNWGSNPANTVGFKYHKKGNSWELADWTKFNWKVGIYRGSSSGTSTLFFDNISYGRNQNHLQGL